MLRFSRTLGAEGGTLPVVSLFSGVLGLELGLSSSCPQLGKHKVIVPNTIVSAALVRLVHSVCYATSSDGECSL